MSRSMAICYDDDLRADERSEELEKAEGEGDEWRLKELREALSERPPTHDPMEVMTSAPRACPLRNSTPSRGLLFRHRN